MKVISTKQVFLRVVEEVQGQIGITNELSSYRGVSGFILYAGDKEYFISEEFLTPLIKKGLIKRVK